MDTETNAADTGKVRLEIVGARTIAFAALCLAFMFGLYPLLDSSAISFNEPALYVVFGIILGQSVFAAIIAGLYGSNWTTGLLIGSFLVMASFALFLQGATLFGSAPPRDVWLLLYLSPSLTFAAMLPLLIARYLGRAQLVLEDRRYARYPASLGKLFGNVVIVAGIVMTLRAPQITWGTPPAQFWTSCMIVGAIIALLSTLVSLPAAWSLNARSWQHQLAILAITAVVVYSIITGIMWTLSLALGPLPDAFYQAGPVVTFVTTCVLFLAVTALRADGFRLQTKETAHRYSKDTDGVVASGYGMAFQIGTVLLLTLVLNVHLGQLQKERNRAAWLVADLHELLGSTNVDLRLPNGVQVGAYIPNAFVESITIPNSNNETVARAIDRLAEAEALDRLISLHVSGFNVDDEALKAIGRSRRLQALDISQADVRGVGFRHLQQMEIAELKLENLVLDEADWNGINGDLLHTLSVAHSVIDAKRFAAFVRKLRLFNLDLTGVELNEELWKLIPSREYLTGLTLSQTNVTAEDLVRLEDMYINKLDLSMNEIGDECMRAVAKLTQLKDLNLRGTRVTDAGVALLLPQVRETRHFSLNISETDINGTAFSKWDRLPMTLNVSKTDINDSLVDQIIRIQKQYPAGLRVLDLSHTEITDAILPKLAQINCRRIVITGTQLSPKAMAQVPRLGPSINQWEIGDQQFSEMEKNNLQMAGFQLYTKDTPVW